MASEAGGPPVETDSTRVCEVIVGLGDVEILGVDDRKGKPLRLEARGTRPRPACGGCGGRLWSKGARAVLLAELAGVRPAGEAGVAQAPLEVPRQRLPGGVLHRAGPRHRA